MAFSLTGDAGCEYGGGVSCYGDTKGGPKQSFLGFMLYNRFWFHHDLFGLTLGGGKINNPGRYLVLLPPINGESAITAATNSPYFTENPGDPFKAWDSSITFDYMPKQYITFRWEYDYRHANVPYWTWPWRDNASRRQHRITHGLHLQSGVIVRRDVTGSRDDCFARARRKIKRVVPGPSQGRVVH